MSSWTGWAAAQAFVNAGMKVAAGQYHRGTIVKSLTCASMRSKRPHPYALMLPQSETERLLEQHLQRLRRAGRAAGRAGGVRRRRREGDGHAAASPMGEKKKCTPHG